LYIIEILPQNPCNPSPCGPNSQCREINNQAVCSCVPGYIGSPPSCRPECVLSSDCALNRACLNQKCLDPCPGTCGIGAQCLVVNHNPICSCPFRQTGNPFVQCIPIRKSAFFSAMTTTRFKYVFTEDEPVVVPSTDPCQPSPCGPYSECRVINGQASCSCLVNYAGSPPNCRPECVSNNECSFNLACINQKCRDPCPGVCGLNAECRVVSHVPECYCIFGFIGNPFVSCAVQICKHLNCCIMPLLLNL